MPPGLLLQDGKNTPLSPMRPNQLMLGVVSKGLDIVSCEFKQQCFPKLFTIACLSIHAYGQKKHFHNIPVHKVPKERLDPKRPAPHLKASR